MSKMKDVLIAQEWQGSQKSGRQSNSNSEGAWKNNSIYKGKKNPVRKDGRAQKMFLMSK